MQHFICQTRTAIYSEWLQSTSEKLLDKPRELAQGWQKEAEVLCGDQRQQPARQSERYKHHASTVHAHATKIPTEVIAT